MQQRTSTRDEYLKCVNVVVEYINNHLGEEIDLSSLAEMSNFSPFHFHRIMKALLGEPIGAFIVRTRIEAAARLLRYTDMTISDIAYQVGYNAPSSLSKLFKQFYGISPIEYRNNKEYTIMKKVELNSNLDVSVEVKEITSKKLIYIRLSGDYKGLDFASAWGRLFKFAQEENLISDNCIEYLCVYHDDPKVTESDKLRTDICLALSKSAKAKGEVGVKEIPGGKYAIFRYKGPYSNLSAVYDTVYGRLVQDNGFKVVNSPVFEKYVNNPSDTAPENLITEIYIPVE